MPNIITIRSIMFTPAIHIDRFKRILLSQTADVCLLDCEDSVSANYKAQARENLHNLLMEQKFTDAPIAIRINPYDCQDGINDINILNKCKWFPDYLVVPKVEKANDIKYIEEVLNCSSRNIRIIALIESVKGIQNAEEIAAASSQLSALMFGSADYTNDLGGEICWDSLLFARTILVHAARNNSLGVIDTPYFNISDKPGLIEECKRVKKLGFSGRCVIHPSQIDTINTIFSYSKETIDKARRIISAAKNSSGNICRVDGEMVGAPIINQAKTILRHSESFNNINS